MLGGGALGGGAGRGALLAGLDAMLRRLGTDHLDLWQLPGWDADVPLDETLSAVQVAVMSGRVRYTGLVGAGGLAARDGGANGPSAGPGRRAGARRRWSTRCWHADAEAELLPAAGPPRLGLLAWAPLGRGVLTGKYAGRHPGRLAGPRRPALAPYVEARRNERSARIVQAVLTAADGLGTSPLAVALAWVRDRPGVAAAVVGARDAAQLAASMAAEDVTLPAEIRAALDDVSAPCCRRRTALARPPERA